MKRALIVGRGVAALSCASILARSGWQIVIRGKADAARPTLLIGSLTVDLLENIFGDATEIFYDAHPISRRQVRWEPTGDPTEVDHAGLVIEGRALTMRLETSLKKLCRDKIIIDDSSSEMGGDNEAGDDFDWVILAGTRADSEPQLMACRREYSFGKRKAMIFEVNLPNKFDRSLSMVEALPKGWLFFSPVSDKKGFLQVVLPSLPRDVKGAAISLLNESSMFKPFIVGLTDEVSMFDASPKIAANLSGGKWLRVGGAAFTVDPLCGDGTGYALRTAILAAAVIRSSVPGRLNREDCLCHYQSRLLRTFLAHLRACHSFYSTKVLDSSWSTEKRSTEVGMISVRDWMAESPECNLFLQRFDLVSADR